MNIQNAEVLPSQLAEQLSRRRSVREFAQDTIPEEILLCALRCANSAPSGANLQPWFFSICRDKTLKSKIRQAAEDVEATFYEKRITTDWRDKLRPIGTDQRKKFLEDADTLIIVFYRTAIETPEGLAKTYYPIESTGIATGFLLMALHQLGVATLTHTPRPMSFLNEILQKDSTYRPYMIVAAGSAHPNYCPPDLVKQDLCSRSEYL